MAESLMKGKTKAEIDLDVRRREQRAVQLRALNWSFADIADDVGWNSANAARDAVQRCLDRHEEKDVDTVRQVAKARIDWAEAKLVEIIEGFEPLVDHGHIMSMPMWDEERQQNVKVPLRDLKPVIAALREYRQYEARRAALQGLDAPMRKILEVVPSDVIEGEIRRIEAQSAAMREELGITG